MAAMKSANIGFTVVLGLLVKACVMVGLMGELVSVLSHEKEVLWGLEGKINNTNS